jgi:hypothetical protein
MRVFVADMLGHASVQLTLDRFSDVTPDDCWATPPVASAACSSDGLAYTW